MKNKGIIGVIVGIMVIGVATTLCTNSYITRQEEMGSSEFTAAEIIKETKEEREVPMETFAMAAAPEVQKKDRLLQRAAADEKETVSETSSLPVEGTPDVALAEAQISFFEVSEEEQAGNEASTEEVSSHHKRLMELDAQIQKIRDEETESTTYSMKTAAENELKLWDSERNAIYNDILDLLDEEETKEMIKQEREWMKDRDALAVEAAKRSAGGTLEGLEYTASLAESTRQRAYELADLYTNLLEEGS